LGSEVAGTHFPAEFRQARLYHGEREQNKRSEEAKRFWEGKSLEPTFLPNFGRTVMFVIDHMPFWVYVITEKGNKIKGLRKQKDFGK
jgi:hypothetical protein